MHIDESKLESFMIDSGLVSKVEIARAKSEAKGKNTSIGKVLVSNGSLTEDDLRRTQAYILGIPFIDLKNQKLDFSVLSLIPEPVARNHNIVAFKKTNDSLEVAMLDTEDLTAIDFVKKKVGLKILPRLTDDESMRWALLSYQKTLKAEFGDIIQKEANLLKAVSDKIGGEDITENDLKKLSEDIPVVRIVDTLLKHAIIQDASDIHIEPEEDKVLVRYRIDGILRDAMVLPKNTASGITARIKVLSSLRLDEKRVPQDGRFKIDAGGEKVSLRVSTLPVYYGEKTVMRLLRESVSGFTLESLGFHGHGLDGLHKALKATTGMILATGPTGSGKTTTLYTMLDIINTPNVNISTIEDPVEYQMTRINQTQVRPEIGLTFANGLRTLVRQDPDIIMVGEIRDNETAALAINASLTGHLVLSTLHTNSAAGAIPRLLDMKVEPFLLVSTLDIVIAQRLVRKLSASMTKYFLNKGELASLGNVVSLDRILALLKQEKIIGAKDGWDKIPFWKPNPGKDSEDGYSSRIGIHEVLKVTPTVKNLIMKGATAGEIEEQAKLEGMMTMIEDGIFKAAQGITTIEEVLRVISE
ncbi:MAG: Type II secretion system protein E [Parcubacteria group bacterium GW2011_GWF2_44_8b]|nr:MAG: Type II secretion system protein E [Parcubacteria group bacterium GW2011_GWC1_43_30]KKT79100.1 MAG: Type II secretion system protein E [Parcubacteria group bacterium GW2011_GWF2_44_8b]